jgi:hypothetical protein
MGSPKMSHTQSLSRPSRQPAKAAALPATARPLLDGYGEAAPRSRRPDAP